MCYCTKGVSEERRVFNTTCVSCACVAKHEEEPDFVPTFDELNQCTNNAYTVGLIRQVEVIVLNSLEWKLNVVTPLHFLNLYLDCGIVFEDDLLDGFKRISPKTVAYVNKYAFFLTDLCLQGKACSHYVGWYRPRL